MEQKVAPMREIPCNSCGIKNLTFETPPLFCSLCHSFIERNAMHYYYSSDHDNAQHYFCAPCHDVEARRGDTIVLVHDGSTILVSNLKLTKNNGETQEWWVECDQCGTWEHQICALFNARRNNEYSCTNCDADDTPPAESYGVLGAKDLPTTLLSDHLEHRLFRKLEKERLERAKAQGKSYDQVSGAERLVVRVVSSVGKQLQVKQRFLDIFKQENYPTEFPYKSKVVLLFQSIEDVEVCLFGMFVQEFGSEAQSPNQRRVCLSYLDSVKHFSPAIKVVTGESLRTFVYHEILIGYLEYCKKRGFASCYIWALPPSEGRDYIFYRHPKIQKRPNSEKLRVWFLSMLGKAAAENIVVDITNLYDHFFVSSGECKAMVTAARLPYFDGDFWPGAAENCLTSRLPQEELSDMSEHASEDILLMSKLGETICPMKEDFIVVHLQHACNHCRVLMVSGNRWVCDHCENFQLCDKCYETELKREERERHPINQSEKHGFHPVEINEVPTDTRDKDEILESGLFETGRAFPSLCQSNHFQYDKLRRAKHSSMMLLYYLHNPTALARATTCRRCRLDIGAGRGWRCEVCSEYYVCDACYHNSDENKPHPHKLTSRSSAVDPNSTENQEARQMRDEKRRKMMDPLVHGSSCRNGRCGYLNCRRMKLLFRHAVECKTRPSGGCLPCQRVWHLLGSHARACKDSPCPVPRCREIRDRIQWTETVARKKRRARR